MTCCINFNSDFTSEQRPGFDLCRDYLCSDFNSKDRTTCLRHCSVDDVIALAVHNAVKSRSVEEASKAHERRQVHSLNACIETHCHNVNTRLRSCVVEKCLSGRMMTSRNASPIDPNHKEVDRSFIRPSVVGDSWGGDVENSLGFEGKSRPRKRWQHPNDKCIEKCSSGGEGAIHTCLDGCLK